MKQKCILLLIAMLVLMSCRDELDPSIVNTTFGLTALKYEFVLALLSLISGFTMIIAGIVLMILGLSGNVEWIVQAADFQSRLINASPGLVLTFAGSLLVWKSRMDVTARKEE